MNKVPQSEITNSWSTVRLKKIFDIFKYLREITPTENSGGPITVLQL